MSLHGYEIEQIRADDIEWVLIALSDKGLAQRTINLYRSAIRQIMRRAVGRVISANPAPYIRELNRKYGTRTPPIWSGCSLASRGPKRWI